MRDEARVSKECWLAVMSCVDAAAVGDDPLLQQGWDVARSADGRFAWSARDNLLELLLLGYMDSSGLEGPLISGVGCVANECWRGAGGVDGGAGT
jgi:hypothetical protein